MLIKYLRRPVRFDYLNKWLNKKHFKVLDVGCGNHSPSVTKKYFPEIDYYGLDMVKNYNSDEEDLRCMEKFYEVDLAKSYNLDIIPDIFFDGLILSHVIEHLENGEKVILDLLHKLNTNGIIYIEFPSPHSVYLPRMKGTLNFYDDPSHVKLYNVKKLNNLLKENGCIILKSGIRHSLKKIILLPLYAVSSLFSFGNISSSVFWDITGFASYIIAIKK
ncbi:methyltransferase domain-containing protein [Candidatus Desantisbacteria bacterium]|nr:methyltransferase domain-containing protein [Candidatus Desantisbacteria bacterium]